MLSLHTNASSLTTMNSMSSTNKSLSSTMAKLGSGFRVNSAMDDAAGLQIATRLNAQSRGMQVAQKNTQNGISMLQTAEGAMGEVNNMLLRMKDLATEAANGTSSAEDKAAMQAEFDALGSEISNILNNTSFAGSKLFSDGNKKSGGSLGDLKGIQFQVGSTAAETVKFEPGATGNSLTKLLEALKLSSAKIELDPNTGAAPTAPNDNLPGKNYSQTQQNAAANFLDKTWEELDDGDKSTFNNDKAVFSGAVKGAIENPTEGQIAAVLNIDTSDTWENLKGTIGATFHNSEALYKSAIAAAIANPPDQAIAAAKTAMLADPADGWGDTGVDVTKFGQNEDIYNAAMKRVYEDPTGDQRFYASQEGKAWADLSLDAQALFGDQKHFTGFQEAMAREKAAAAAAPAPTPTTTAGAGTELDAADPTAILTTLNDAINAVGTFRSDLGAVANRLEHTYNNLGNMITNTDIAKGRIMDVDYAAESAAMTKNQMLMQVSTSMLKQSNSLSQMVGSLVQ